MKYNSKAQIYRASNLSWDYNTGIGLSYDWYIIAKRFGDLYILNNYSYSPTTTRHVYKIRKLFDEKGIAVTSFEAPRGLQDLDAAIEHYQRLIRIEQSAIAKPRARKSKVEERKDLIKTYDQKIELIKRLKGE